MRYFQKLDPSSGFITSKGKLFKFPDLGNGIGAVETDHPSLIKEFEIAMSRSVGGVSEISKEDFEKLKKNSQSPPPRPQPSVTLDQLTHLNAGLRPDVVGGNGRSENVFPSSGVKVPNELRLPAHQAQSRDFRPKSVVR